jgi:cytochrome oxidase Cu insertion factor (SCO1/SenC/PrrC family)
MYPAAVRGRPGREYAQQLAADWRRPAHAAITQEAFPVSSSTPEQEAPGPSGGDGGPRRHGGLPRLLLLASVLTVLLAAVVAIPAYLVHQRDHTALAAQQARVSGIPASVSTSLANLMVLSPLPPDRAPGFTLTDQNGHRLSLSSLRGKVVVLQFMDPHCTDICPIVSAEFVKAYHDLGPLASKVVFAAINVNAYHARVQDMAAYTRAQALNTIPSWHFVTGPVSSLRSVWRAYHIEVYAPSPNADVQHTSAVYFIDPQGRVRFLATPEVDHTKSGTAFLPARQQIAWGHGIALVARQLAG